MKDERGSGQNGPFRNGAAYGDSYERFDPSLERINSYSQGSSVGGYTVRAGESLSSIAANLWGGGLWYKLAQANGLSGEAALSEGQSLRIPSGVMKNTHNASTFKPYDTGEAIGDTAPTAAKPKPPKKNKCGAFGQVMLVVIAVTVTIATKGAAAQFFAAMFGASVSGAAATIASGATAGAAGSAASQAVGVPASKPGRRPASPRRPTAGWRHFPAMAPQGAG